MYQLISLQTCSLLLFLSFLFSFCTQRKFHVNQKASLQTTQKRLCCLLVRRVGHERQKQIKKENFTSNIHINTCSHFVYSACFWYSATSQNAMGSRLARTPASWVGSRSNYILAMNKLLWSLFRIRQTNHQRAFFSVISSLSVEVWNLSWTTVSYK